MKKKTVMQENMKTIVDQLQQGQPIEIKWKWSISRAKEYDGQNICTCLANGLKVGRCIGGGYAMETTSLEDLIQEIANAQNIPIKVQGGRGFSYMFDTVLSQLGIKYKSKSECSPSYSSYYYIIYK